MNHSRIKIEFLFLYNFEAIMTNKPGFTILSMKLARYAESILMGGPPILRMVIGGMILTASHHNDTGHEQQKCRRGLEA